MTPIPEINLTLFVHRQYKMLHFLMVNLLFSIYTPWVFSTSNIHEPWNITWQIIAPHSRSVVTQVSGTHPQGTWWPSLKVDICYLLSQDSESSKFTKDKPPPPTLHGHPG